MDPYRDNIVTFGHLLGGYDAACERFWAAAKEPERNLGFYALFEALNWAVALDERSGEHWAPDGQPLGWKWRDRIGGAEVMRGVRFARNSVHHQWTHALVARPLTDVTPQGFVGGPDAFGFARPEAESLGWVWRDADELPQAQRRDAAGEATYRRSLEGRPAALTREELQRVFWKLWQLLERPMFPGHIGSSGRGQHRQALWLACPCVPSA